MHFDNPADLPTTPNYLFEVPDFIPELSTDTIDITSSTTQITPDFFLYHCIALCIDYVCFPTINPLIYPNFTSCYTLQQLGMLVLGNLACDKVGSFVPLCRFINCRHMCPY